MDFARNLMENQIGKRERWKGREDNEMSGDVLPLSRFSTLFIPAAPLTEWWFTIISADFYILLTLQGFQYSHMITLH